MTINLVSHDVPEIFKLSERVIIIEKGVILRDDKPADIYINQKTSHKFSFTGKLIRLLKADIIYIAFVSIGKQKRFKI
jgi:molybdate transport system ATP-binding protein